MYGAWQETAMRLNTQNSVPSPLSSSRDYWLLVLNCISSFLATSIPLHRKDGPTCDDGYFFSTLLLPSDQLLRICGGGLLSTADFQPGILLYTLQALLKNFTRSLSRLFQVFLCCSRRLVPHFECVFSLLFDGRW
jgi:hypothetical protein